MADIDPRIYVRSQRRHSKRRDNGNGRLQATRQQGRQ